MPIEGLSDQRELPRGGTLRLGDEKSANRPGKQLGHFRFDPHDPRLAEAFREVYGEEPRSLVVALHSDDREEVFSDYYRLWKGQRVWCFGDNRRAWRMPSLEASEREEVACGEDCPFRKTYDARRDKDEGRDCQPEGWLKVLLPELPTTLVFDVTCRMVSIRWVSTVLDLLQSRFGRLSGIPLVLSLKEFKVRGRTNWGPCLDIRQSLIDQVLGGDPRRSLLEAQEAAPAASTTAPVPAASPAPSGPSEAGASPSTNGEQTGNGSPVRRGQPNGNGGSRPQRNPHFTDPQRSTIGQLLSQPVFTAQDKAAWTRSAQRVASPEAAAQLVGRLQVERALRTCQVLGDPQRERVRDVVAQGRVQDLGAFAQRIEGVRTPNDAERLIDSLVAPVPG